MTYLLLMAIAALAIWLYVVDRRLNETLEFISEQVADASGDFDEEDLEGVDEVVLNTLFGRENA